MAVHAQLRTTSLFSRMCMGTKPASASVPPVGDIQKQPVIHNTARHWTANRPLMIPLSLAPYRYHKWSPYMATGTTHMRYNRRL